MLNEEVDGTPDEINATLERMNKLDQHQGNTITDLFSRVERISPDSLEHRFSTPSEALNFMLAGNAYFTLRSRKTGTRYTYRMSLPKKNPDETCRFCKRRPCDCEPNYFVSLLTGADNENDYTYLGIVRRNEFKLTAKSRMNAESVPVRAFSWAFALLTKNELPAELEIWHEGRCGRCGRKLTVPESIAAGIGPECAERMGL